jgi:hypothetical protein
MPKTLAMDDMCEGKEFSFPQQEEWVLELWAKLDAFHEQLCHTEGSEEFVFYDASLRTGQPHYGHILAVHFVYSANGEGEFCAVLAFDSCSSFNTAKPMEEITHFRHYLLNIVKAHILSSTMFSF